MKLIEGDVILVHSKKWLARQIQKWMNLYRIRKGLPTRKLFNHVAVVVDLYGSLHVVESIETGVNVKPDAKAYVDRQDCKVLTWVNPLSAREGSVFSKTAINYALTPHRYDFLNFWYQIRYIITGKWRGPVGENSTKRVYCSELAAIVMDKTRGTFKGITWDKNPLDIDLCEELREKTQADELTDAEVKELPLAQAVIWTIKK